MKAAWATQRGPGEPGFQVQVCQPLGLLRAERLWMDAWLGESSVGGVLVSAEGVHSLGVTDGWF